jgi:hypothetical protein
MESEGPKIDPWENPCVTVLQLEKKFGIVLDGLFTLSDFHLYSRI